LATEYLLADLAALIGAEIQGDKNCLINHVAPLGRAEEGAISFLTSSKYRSELESTAASAVILKEEEAALCPVNCLITDNPYLGYAKIAQRLYQSIKLSGIAPSAVVSETASIHSDSYIGANVVVGENTVISEGVVIGAGCVIGSYVEIGKNSRIDANVTIYDRSILGERAVILSGAVIGSDGFGFAPDGGKWIKIPQVGRVIIGDDVEVGASSTVDRGALEDTIIGNGVKLDNQVHIGHNVRLGENTAIAGCSGIAGSTVIGKSCTVAGAVGISGHLNITDNVHITGKSMVTKSIEEAGVYSSGIPLQTNKNWRRSVARFKQLDEMAKRLKQLEKMVKEDSKS
jgi:UDP-3-O-[3-hydroxymyristoyl] glucosamine N-acyltransferase